MSKLWAVFVREYLTTVKTKTFVFAVVLMPILMAGAGALPLIAERHADPAIRRCAVIDRSGVLFEPLLSAAEARNAKSSEATAGPGRDHYVVERVEAATRADAQRLALSDRVRAGDLFCFIEIDPRATAADGDHAIRYYTATPTHLHLPRWLETTLQAEIHRHRLRADGIDASAVARAQRPVEVERASLYQRGSDGSAVSTGRRDPIRDVGFPVGLAMLMFLAVMMGSGPLMQSVLEEKMQRIAEILVSSVPPAQLMLGKLLGASAVSFTLLTLYVSGGWFIASRFGYDAPVAFVDALWIASFQAVALVMYGSVFLAVGSACSDLRQSQTLMMPVMLVVMAPLLLLNLVVADPNGTGAVALSFVPFFTPLLMMLRVTLPPGAPVWQGLLGLAVSGAFAALCVFAAARIFRVGMLVQGAAPKLREIARWVLRG